MIEEDSLFEELTRLPSVTPDTARETRVRQRCHAALSNRASRARPITALDIVAATALYVYFAAAFAEAVRVLKPD